MRGLGSSRRPSGVIVAAVATTARAASARTSRLCWVLRELIMKARIPATSGARKCPCGPRLAFRTVLSPKRTRRRRERNRTVTSGAIALLVPPPRGCLKRQRGLEDPYATRELGLGGDAGLRGR